MYCGFFIIFAIEHRDNIFYRIAIINYILT